jgi:polyketide-type polyunsaturated fatty acid synthase PfaA
VNNKNIPIAIVGASAIFPGSPNLELFWKNIVEGNSLIQSVPKTHWLKEDYYQASPGVPDKVYAYNGAFLPDTPFDPAEFGIPPKLLTSIDTAQLFALIATKNLLKDIKSIQQEKIDRKRIGVILGVAAGTELMVQMSARIQQPVWAKVLREASLPENQIQQICNNIAEQYVPWNEATFPGLLSNVVAGRVANRFDLGGTNCVIDAACASSLASVKMAIAELCLHEADLVITGGVDTFNEIFMYMCFSQTPALSPSGNCRPFSAEADGTILGEGVGLIGLRRLADAERDGDKIYAVINSIGSSSDGKMKSIYAPSSEGQANAIKRAKAQVDYSLAEVELVEAHGTGTKAGDIAEFNGLKLAFDEVSEKQYCALGSIKSQIGHTKSTAGAASILKIIMALNHKVLPPTINIDKPNPNLALAESAFYLNTRARPWLHSSQSTRKASVSSFGFGGSNFHVMLEEYRARNQQPVRFYQSPVHLFLLCAMDQTKLLTAINGFRNELQSSSLSLLAKNTQLKFVAAHPCRLALLAKDATECLALLNQFETMLQKNTTNNIAMPGKFYYVQTKQNNVGKIAFLFPGQGSQYLNMAADLAMQFESVRKVYDDALALPQAHIKDILKLIFPIPVFSEQAIHEQLQALTQTQWAQPAIGLTSIAILNLLKQLNIQADCYAGHSYGELTALYAANVFDSLADFITASHERGNLMAAASATRAGAMLAVFTDEKTLQSLITSQNVTWANINSERQIVLSGDIGIISEVENLLNQKHISCKRLNVATAFHSSHVSHAAEQFHAYLNTIKLKKPTIPIYANTTAKNYPKSVAALRKLLAEQLANPVLFKEQLLQMYADGVRIFIEIGPGNALTGFVKDTLPASECITVTFNRKDQNGLVNFWDSLAKLATAGITLDFQSLWNEFYLEEATGKEAITKTSIMINGANIGKPYPPLTEQVKASDFNKSFETVNEPTKNILPPDMSVLNKPLEPVLAETATPENFFEQGESFMSVKKTTDMPISEWFAAFQTLQVNMLEAQRSFQSLLLQSHTQFLQTSEIFLQQLNGLEISNTDNIQRNMPARPAITAAPALPEISVNNISQMFSEQPLASPEIIKHMPPAPAIAPTLPQEVVNKPIINIPDKAVNLPVANQNKIADKPAQPINYQALLLNVVADKTGYPPEMLELSMDLESELGIDSIKRVEILSALQADIPELKNADPKELSSLRTLADILKYAEKLSISIDAVMTNRQQEVSSQKKLVDAAL